MAIAGEGQNGSSPYGRKNFRLAITDNKLTSRAELLSDRSTLTTVEPVCLIRIRAFQKTHLGLQNRANKVQMKSVRASWMVHVESE